MYFFSRRIYKPRGSSFFAYLIRRAFRTDYVVPVIVQIQIPGEKESKDYDCCDCY